MFSSEKEDVFLFLRKLCWSESGAESCWAGDEAVGNQEGWGSTWTQLTPAARAGNAKSIHNVPLSTLLLLP